MPTGETLWQGCRCAAAPTTGWASALQPCRRSCVVRSVTPAMLPLQLLLRRCSAASHSICCLCLWLATEILCGTPHGCWLCRRQMRVPSGRRV